MGYRFRLCGAGVVMKRSEVVLFYFISNGGEVEFGLQVGPYLRCATEDRGDAKTHLGADV